jgi:hypothetical protein
VDRTRRPRRRVLVSVVLTALLVGSTTAIVAAQTRPVGTDGSSAANAPKPPAPPPLTGSAFWSGATTDVLDPAANSTPSLGEAGPIPAGWWTITGQLTILGNSGSGTVACNLLASGATQTNAAGEFSGGFPLAQLYDATIGLNETVTVPIRVLVNTNGFGPATLIANVQCRTNGFGASDLGADLLVVPTKDGKIGL